VDRTRIDRWLEGGILALLLAIILIAPLAFGAVLPRHFLIIQCLTLGMLGLWLARVWVKPDASLLWAPACWTVFAFAGYAVARHTFADIEYVSRQELLAIVVYASVFFTVANNLYRRQPVWWGAGALIAVTALISAYAVFQFMTHSTRVWTVLQPANYANRASGTYICPNHLAGLIGMVLPMALSLTLAGRISHVARLLLGYATLLLVAGLAVTVSRAGWLAGALAVATLLLVLAREKKFTITLALAATVLFAAGYFFYNNSDIARKRAAAISANVATADQDNRSHYWSTAVKIWETSPLWGVGGGHYDHRYRAVRPPSDRAQGRPGWVHNDYLNTLTDYGVAGLLLVLATPILVVAGIIKSWRFIRRSPDGSGKRAGNKTATVLGYATALVAIAVHSFFDFNLHIPANALVLVIWLAFATTFMRYIGEDYWHGLKIPGRVLTSLVLMVVMGWLGWQSWRGAQEQHWLRVATRSSTQLEKVAALKRAHAIEPLNPETVYNLGETLRQISWEGADDYAQWAQQAMDWFKLAMPLNPYDPYSRLRYGMCLHWIGQHAAAQPYFDQALELDPNSYYMLAHMGWHYFQLERYVEARRYFMRSHRLNWWNNPMTLSYLRVIEEREKEKAALAPR
jgi:O-antigen ligase